MATMAINPATAAVTVALAGAATILGAWFFEYGIGLAPCPLCLDQRIPYYVGIPLAALTAFAATRGAPRRIVMGGLVLLAAIFVVGAALGIYHAGIEWKWWTGPQECSGILPLNSSKGMLDRLERPRFVRCDEAAWRFLGLSLAGYNALISIALAGIAGVGAVAARDDRSTMGRLDPTHVPTDR
jgi:disulfide bond formation protein DsbB